MRRPTGAGVNRGDLAAVARAYWQMPNSQRLSQHSLVCVQRCRRRTQVDCRQVPLPQTPEQQWLPVVQAPFTGLQVVSQRPAVQRWLQQSTWVVQAAPGSTHDAAQRESKPQRLPAQHQESVRQKAVVPAHATCRQIPREQLRLQQSPSAVQVAPSRPQVVAVRQTPLVHMRPSQQPEPQGCPSTAQVTGAWHEPLMQERPAQHPAPQGCPRAAQVVTASQRPALQRLPAQHSPSNTQRLPALRHPQTPPVQSM